MRSRRESSSRARRRWRATGSTGTSWPRSRTRWATCTSRASPSTCRWRDDNLGEAESWAAALAASQIDTSVLYVSHLSTTELLELAERRPQLQIKPRVGTALWLGDLGAFDVRSTVLDLHHVSRGERVGYRQRPVPRDGFLLVLAGGTSHGLGLEAPRAQGSALQRGKTLAKGGLEAAGFTLSPFFVDGKQRWFAEPPHMQASLVFLPSSARPPEVGDTVPAAIRYTTTTFDEITLD